jgi:formate hydrogenlyase transcriptional activator
VRELQNVIERAVILASGELLQLSDLELPFVSTRSGPASASSGEKASIEEALRASRGRVSGADGAAAALGVAASTLEARIRRLGIDKYGFRTRCRG